MTKISDKPCKNCHHLTYYDNFMCKKGKHTNRHGFLRQKAFESCPDFQVRVGSNWDFCKEMPECVFWCNDCEGYKKYKPHG